MTDPISDEQALREFLLDLLVEAPRELLRTPEGREQALATYEAQAKRAHPAVAEVLRQAAMAVRGM